MTNNPLATAWQELSAHCLTAPATVSMHPDKEEVIAVIADLDHLRRETVKLLRAYGDIITDRIPHTDPDYVRQAVDMIDDAFEQLTGNLVSAGETIDQEWREFAADRTSWSRAHAMGVD